MRVRYDWSEVQRYYDAGLGREHARRRMLRALEEYVIEGIPTLIGFHRALLSHPCFVDGETCHGLVESELLARQAAELGAPRLTAHADSSRLDARTSFVELDGRRYEVKLLVPEPAHKALVRRRRERGAGRHHAATRDAVTSPMQGTVLAVEVEDGVESSFERAGVALKPGRG